VNLECPFNQTEFPDGQGTCPESGFVVESTADGNLRFFSKGEQNGIYESYEGAYEGLAEDDLSSAIYAEEYQRDLALETHSKMGSVAGLEVAELGVGRGFLQRGFLRQGPKSLLALDIAEDYVLNSRKIYEDSDSRSTSFRTAVGNVEFMPFRECFDWVVATDILEHVLNLGNALVRIARSLKPGGRFACRVPFKEALGQYSIYNGQKYEFAHLRFFDGPSLRRQLAEAGLKPIKTFCFGYQSHRFKPCLPSLPGRVLGKAFDLCGFYGREWHDFNRKSRSLPLRPLRLLHQPLELLVFSQKT